MQSLVTATVLQSNGINMPNLSLRLSAATGDGSYASASYTIITDHKTAAYQQIAKHILAFAYQHDIPPGSVGQSTTWHGEKQPHVIPTSPA
jgi:hypothetical protein